jgi:filamentous hemagglutinin
LWDSKYRSADVSLGHSPTFVNQAARIAAIAEARQRIAANASLSPSVKSQAITNLDLGNFMTNTVGAGQVRNSVQVRFCNGNPC